MIKRIESLSRRQGAQLAAVLLVAGLIATLFHISEGSAAGSLISPAERKPLPDLAFTALNGQTWRLAEQQGKVVLVNVWATWCPPCRQETPGLVAIANEYRGEALEIIGASMDESVEPVQRFIKDFQVPYTVAMPPKNTPLSAAVEALPTSFLIDREGRVALTYTGAVSERALRADIDRLLAEP